MAARIRAVAYYRKSNEDDGASVDQQREWAQQQAERDGGLILQEFTDQSIAGWDTAKRTAFHAMLAYCQDQAALGNPVHAIYAWHTNRLSRADSFETGAFLHKFREAGVTRLRTRERWIDFDRKEDRALLNLEQDFTNREYVVNLAGDSLRGRLRAAREGRRQGGKPPYAYRAEKEEVVGKNSRRYWRTKRLILGPDLEVQTVRRIFREYATGERGFRLIAQGLSADGIPSPTGKLWSHVTVAAILTDEVYLGWNVYNRRQTGRFFGVAKGELAPRTAADKPTRFTDPADWIVAEGCHEAVIDRATWERVQAVIRGRSFRRGTGGRGRAEYLLTGLMVCGHCGHAMCGRVARSKGREYRKYECQGYQQKGPQACQYGSVDVAGIERSLLALLLPAWLTADMRARVREQVLAQDRAEAAGEPAEISAKRRRLEGIERELDRLTDELLQTDEPREIERLREKKRQRQDERQRLERDLGALEARGPALDPGERADAAMTILDRLAAAATAEDRLALKAVVREAVTRVEVYFERRQEGKRNRSRFAHALVDVVPDLHAVYEALSGAEDIITRGTRAPPAASRRRRRRTPGSPCTSCRPPGTRPSPS